MNVTLKIKEFLKDVFNSFFIIDENTTLLTFCVILLSRLLKFCFLTLFDFIYKIFHFHSSNKISVLEKISFYFEELFMLLFIPYFFVLYYLIRFSFFLFSFVVKSLVLIVVAFLEYSILYYINDDDSTPRVKESERELIARDLQYLIDFLGKFSIDFDDWYYFKTLNFTGNSFQLFFLWAYYFIFIILLDVYVYPYIVQKIVNIIERTTDLIILIIDILIKLYHFVITYFIVLPNNYFLVWSSARKKIFRAKIKYFFFKRLKFFLYYLWNIPYFYLVLSLQYIFLFFYWLYLKFSKILGWIWTITYILFSEFLFNLSTLTLILFTIYKFIYFVFYCKFYLNIFKPVCLFFLNFLHKKLDLIGFFEFIEFLYYLLIAFFIQLPKPISNSILFVLSYFYIVSLSWFLIVSNVIIESTLLFFKLKFISYKFYFACKIFLYNSRNLISYFIFVAYFVIRFFPDFMKLFCLECVNLFHITIYYFNVNFLKFTSCIRKILFNFKHFFIK